MHVFISFSVFTPPKFTKYLNFLFASLQLDSQKFIPKYKKY